MIGRKITKQDHARRRSVVATISISLLLSAWLPNAAGADSATDHNPTGSVTSVSWYDPTDIQVTGTVVDPDGSTYVHVFQDGWTGPFHDLIAVNGQFNGEVPSDGQAHTICVVGVNVGEGTGDVRLNPSCTPIAAYYSHGSHDPTGSVTSVSWYDPTDIQVTGTVVDPDGSTYVHVFQDGWTGPFHDLIAVNGQFNGEVPSDGQAHTICVVGVNVGQGLDVRLNPSCTGIDSYASVASHNPTGSVTSVSWYDPTDIQVTGTVVDPDGSTYVHVFQDGWTGPFHDLIAVNGQFNGEVPSDGQAHTICVVGVNVGPGTGDVQLNPTCTALPAYASPTSPSSGSAPNPTTAPASDTSAPSGSSTPGKTSPTSSGAGSPTTAPTTAAKHVSIRAYGSSPVEIEINKITQEPNGIALVSYNVTNFSNTWYVIQRGGRDSAAAPVHDLPDFVIVGPGMDESLPPVSVRSGDAVEIDATKTPVDGADAYALALAVSNISTAIFGQDVPSDLYWNRATGKSMLPALAAAITAVLNSTDLGAFVSFARDIASARQPADVVTALVHLILSASSTVQNLIFNLVKGIAVQLGKLLAVGSAKALAQKLTGAVLGIPRVFSWWQTWLQAPRSGVSGFTAS